MCVMVMTHKTENRLFPVSYGFSELTDTSQAGKTWKSGQKQAEKQGIRTEAGRKAGNQDRCRQKSRESGQKQAGRQGICIRNGINREMQMPDEPGKQENQDRNR